MSLSRYESERGTVGRGTPPTFKDGQPRLDLLLQQMHRHQVRDFHLCVYENVSDSETQWIMMIVEHCLSLCYITLRNHSYWDKHDLDNNIYWRSLLRELGYISIQERNALQRGHLGREHKLTCNVTTLTDQIQVTNQDECDGDGVMVCEWGECRVNLPSRRQLMTHITKHIQSRRCV